ncbi:hypothetical protein RhiJN_20453 [Ceratobasidium sp. AG-Ba]|nr:hypothetical protein RhiJN_20453 [Ceratobasidium sp. AG-Ba]
MAPYVLEPNKVPPNWLEKLNEWSDKAGKVNWVEQQKETPDGWKWFSTPILGGTAVTDCVGIGKSKPEAQGAAAKLLSDKGKLP